MAKRGDRPFGEHMIRTFPRVVDPGEDIAEQLTPAAYK